ncbi:uncharacterized protein HaLaN_18608 [Haematococcus lacustris]|uniref:RRM domain-containing protein n=1 Tax=Haematococcus lacustris TaxID=44745 RepID=A0A699ZJT8_HAELA|nr:uncharacterized protein HaLaN_18608 [Haematococcus lacustris]
MPMVVKFADAKNNNHNGYPSTGQRGYEGGVFGSPGNMSLAGSQKKPYGSSSSVGSMSPAGGFAAFGMPGYPGMSPMGMQGMSSYPVGGMGMMGMGGMSLGSMGGLRPGVVGPMANPALHGAHMGLAGPPKLMGGGNSLMQHNKMGSGVADETSKQWKLFVGQVPFEASEADLWGVFSTIGPILELVVLRTPQGKSKGCAFVTYENRQLAEKAVHQLDGQVCLPDDPKQRVLIVKFASSPSQQPKQAPFCCLLEAHDDMI